MRTVLSVFAMVAAFALMAQLSLAQDAGANQSVTGILIDQACGSRMMKADNPEKAAEKHPKSCAMKKSCAESGYAVISGDKMLKFEDNGDKLAKDFLAKTDQENDLRVTVEGTVSGDQIAVTSLKAAPDKSGQ